MKLSEFLKELRILNVPEADIKDLLKYRYKIDMPYLDGQELGDKAVGDIELVKREYPLAYLIGHVDFYGSRILLDDSVLIPRVETEELIEIIDKREKHRKFNNILDLCTGSGCIAISLKRLFEESEVYASDISFRALSTAQRNAEYNRTQIYLVQSDYLEYFIGKNITFDLIVSNPPYIRNDATLDKSLSYEPQMALYAGEDGLDAYRAIFYRLPMVFNKHGIAYFELEESNTEDIIRLVTTMLDKFTYEIINDMSNKKRFLRLVHNKY